MFIKTKLVQLHDKMVLSLRKALTSILKVKLLKVNIFELIGFVRDYDHEIVQDHQI